MNIYEIEIDYFDILNISQNDWKNLLNRGIFDSDSLFILKTFYQFENHFATIKDVAYVIGMTEWFVNSTIEEMGKRVREELKIPPIKFSSKELNYIYLFIKYPSDNSFEIRRNLRMALKNHFPDLTIKFKHIHNKLPLILSDRSDYYHFLQIFKSQLYENYKIKEIEELNTTQGRSWEISEKSKYPTLRKYRFEVNIEKILENYNDLSNFQINSYTGETYTTEFLRVYGVMDKKNNIIKKVYFNSGLSVMFHKFGKNKEFLRISLMQGYEKFEFKEFLPDLWNEVFNYLMFIPDGFETFENREMSDDVFLYKKYDLEKIDEETLVKDINNIIVTYIHILPIYKEIIKRLKKNFNNGKEIKFTKKVVIDTQIDKDDNQLKQTKKNVGEQINHYESQEIINNELTGIKSENTINNNVSDEKYDNQNDFSNEKYMDSEEYISLNDFSKEDQENIIKYNGSGNIIFHVKTKTDEFDEIWLFNNKTDKIVTTDNSLIPISPYEIISTKNLEVIPDGELEDINLVFEPFTSEMIENILEENKNKLDNNQDFLSFTSEIKFSFFNKENQDLFKKYSGKGLIIRTIHTRLGRTFQEIWEFNSVEREVLFNEVNDNTTLYLYTESLNNKLNYQFYPKQDLLRIDYSFKPFLDEEYELLKNSIEDFDYEDYMKNNYEMIEGYNFTKEDIELIKKYKNKGLVYYEFKTIKNEVIRDYYEINMMYKHNIEKEFSQLSKQLDLTQFSDDEINNIKKEYDFYDLEVIPYKLGKRNDFTVPEIEKFGSGHWYYQKDKKI